MGYWWTFVGGIRVSRKHRLKDRGIAFMLTFLSLMVMILLNDETVKNNPWMTLLIVAMCSGMLLVAGSIFTITYVDFLIEDDKYEDD